MAKAEIDWEQAKRLAGIMCTNDEIASVLDVHRETLNDYCQELYGTSFGKWCNQYRDTGKASLRRAQYKSAVEQLNPTLLVHLGKNYLGQSDKNIIDHNFKSPTIIDDIPETPETDEC
jgi:AraC-like DNA-binding protein